MDDESPGDTGDLNLPRRQILPISSSSGSAPSADTWAGQRLISQSERANTRVMISP